MPKKLGYKKAGTSLQATEEERPRYNFDEDVAKFTPRQMEAIRLLDSRLIKFLLYGGALGGGKSYFLRWVAVRLLMGFFTDYGIKYVQVMLACEDYPSLKDRQISKMAREFPSWLGTMYVDHKEYGRCFILREVYGSGVICLRNLDDPSKYQCYHPDTEILTTGGFVPVSEVLEDDLVATMNPATRMAEYLPVTATQQYDYDGELVVSDDYKSHVQFAVTPNHDMLIHTRRRLGLERVKAEDLPERFYVPRSAEFRGKSSKTISIHECKLGRAKKATEFETIPFLKFLGWYLSEGSLGSSTRYEIKISQQKAEGLAQLRDDLKDFPYKIYWNDKGAVLYGKALFDYLSQFGKCYDKHIPPDILKLSPDLLQHLFDALMAGDGHRTKEGRHIFVTTSRRLVDDVSILAIHLGYCPTVVPIKDFKTGRYANAVQVWHISITKRDTSMCNRVKRVAYRGKVHCVTVPPFHNVLIRYNNRVMWCGQSAEFAAILVDELTKNDLGTFTDLRMRLRWPGIPDLECCFIGATNPGGVGHAFCKAFWMDNIFPDEFLKPIDYSKAFGYVPSKAEDNPHLDQAYWAQLQTLPPALRDAFRDGSWDLFKGQAFQEWSRQHHVIEPVPVPEGAPVFMTFDWGFGAPFSIGWWWIDADNRKYRFAEWYGWAGTPNSGLRLTDSEIAAGIIRREQAMGFVEVGENFGKKVFNPGILRLCDPTCFNKKPDYRGGGQMPSTAAVMMEAGVMLRPGDPSRSLKYRQFHEHLMVPRDENHEVIGRPMMQIYNTCIHFIRTVPSLILDENNIEDVQCFVAGTMISTPNGGIPIEDLGVGDFVNTPIGAREILKAGISGKEKTITITLSNGTTLEATKDHKIYVNDRGLLPLCLVSSGQTLIQEEKTICPTSKLFSKESDSQSGMGEDILNVIQAMQGYLGQPFCIGQYGSRNREKSPQGIMSTTEITTQETTILAIWNSFLRAIMQDNISKSELKPVAISPYLLDIGETVSKGKPFFATVLKNAVKILPKENLRALIVANLLQQGIQGKNIALQNVKNLATCMETNKEFAQSATNHSQSNPIHTKKSELAVTSVVGSSEEKVVYYLTVDQAHLFYANGVLTANTDGEDHCYDEACHIVMQRPLKKGDAPPEIRRPPADISVVAKLEREKIWEEINAELTGESNQEAISDTIGLW